MHKFASSQTIQSFKALINNPASEFYVDTCFGLRKDHNTPSGLDFIKFFKKDFIRAGKKINIIHYVKNELAQKLKREETWAGVTAKFILNNKEIFRFLKKSEIENELDNLRDLGNFADEALRRMVLASASHDRRPIVLTGDLNCGLGIQSSSPEASVYIISRPKENEYPVQPVDDYAQQKKNLYAADTLPAMLSHSDIILTRAALKSKGLASFLQMLNLSSPKNEKLPVYVHEISLNKVKMLPMEFQALSHKLHIVKDGGFNNEESRLLATYAARKNERDIFMVGNLTSLTPLRDKIAKFHTSFISGRLDRIRYFSISDLGRLLPVKELNTGASSSTSHFHTADFWQGAEPSHARRNEDSLVANIMTEARKGTPLAMRTLSHMYDKGDGVSQSNLMAQLWKTRSNLAQAKQQTPSPSCYHSLKNNLSRLRSTVQDLARFVLYPAFTISYK